MSGRRGRPPGARPPSEKDLKTPKIGVFFHQQPFAPIFQQRMGGGASQGAGSQHDHVDLTGGSGESCSEDVTSSSAQNNTPTAAEARDSLQQFLATYSDSEEEDGAPSSEQDSPSMTTKTSSTGAVLSVPAATLCSSDGSEEEDDGEDSEELDSADTGPSGECLTKRGAPVTTSGGGAKRRKN